MSDKQKIIEYLLTSYNSGEKATRLGIAYSVINKTFFIEMGRVQQSLTLNELADSPDGIGDDLANKIKSWAV